MRKACEKLIFLKKYSAVKASRIVHTNNTPHGLVRPNKHSSYEILPVHCKLQKMHFTLHKARLRAKYESVLWTSVQIIQKGIISNLFLNFKNDTFQVFVILHKSYRQSLTAYNFYLLFNFTTSKIKSQSFFCINCI